MTLYAIALFLHVTGALGLFVTIGLEWTSLARLRRAASVDQARQSLGELSSLRRVGMPSVLTLLVTGIYLTVIAWRGTPWPLVGLVAMVLIAVLGGALSGRRVGSISRALPAEPGPLHATLVDRVRDPILVLSARLRASLALGIVFIMCIKPSLAGSLTAMGAALALGLVAGLAGFPARSAALKTR